MPFTPVIEVAVPPETNSTQRGDILEKFSKRLLQTQNFNVTQKLRATGMEIDLLAVERMTGERILVECKAHRQTISANVLSQLHGNVDLEGLSAGWLLSTFALGKDAKGMADKWAQRPPSERRRLQIYDPERLVEKLVAANVVVSPDKLARPAELRIGEDAYLLLTLTDEYWALVVLDDATGIPNSALLYHAHDGRRISDEKSLAAIAETDTTLARLNWIEGTDKISRSETDRLRGELQNIVSVPIAEHWADYRPARPQDFVGRDDLQKDVFDWFDKVRLGNTKTRLIAIKAPSGWGKSSFVLKVVARARNIRNKNKIFVYAVDSRAATSKRFGELALSKSITEAIRAGFVKDPGGVSFGGADAPFSTEAMKEVMRELARDQKVICLFFDQFEELLYKQELEQVFDEIRALCNAIDAALENVTIGFSWKTDGTIPTEHGAYHLWHDLSDRRLEFELTPFADSEVTIALNRFQRELGQPIAPPLRRLLKDHCQGYPWLLKKLCIHVLDLVKTGMDQSDVLLRSLSIQELFNRDLEGLTQAETSCIRQICVEAPAEFFKIVNTYGDDVVTRLMSKRLVIRSGPRLSIYWDIFRDYVLTDKIPSIPINYIPQANFTNYVSALRLVLRSRTSSYEALANELGVSKGTADNIVRDLVMIGHAEAIRKSETVTAVHATEEEAARILLAFFKSHIVYTRMIADIGPDGTFSATTMKNVTRRVLTSAGLSNSIVNTYAQKLLRWFEAVGLVESKLREYVLRPSAASLAFISKASPTYLRRGLNMFLAESPPYRAVNALSDIILGVNSREEIERRHGRNTVVTLMNLALIDGHAALLLPHEERSAEELVRNSASSSATIALVREYLTNSPTASGENVGDAVARRFGFTWAVGSKRRYGTALKQWAGWLFPVPVFGAAAIPLDFEGRGHGDER
jgi:hypothetical protein